MTRAVTVTFDLITMEVASKRRTTLVLIFLI